MVRIVGNVSGSAEMRMVSRFSWEQAEESTQAAAAASTAAGNILIDTLRRII